MQKSVCKMYIKNELITLQNMLLYLCSVQFSSVAQSCPTLCDPMNHSTPGLPVHHQLLEFTQTHVHRVSDAIQPSHPLLSPFPPAPIPSQHQSHSVRPTLCDLMDYSPPGSSVCGILQARILEWVAMPSSWGSSRPRDQTRISYVSCIGRQILYH